MCNCGKGREEEAGTRRQLLYTDPARPPYPTVILKCSSKSRSETFFWPWTSLLMFWLVQPGVGGKLTKLDSLATGQWQKAQESLSWDPSLPYDWLFAFHPPWKQGPSLHRHIFTDTSNRWLKFKKIWKGDASFQLCICWCASHFPSDLIFLCVVLRQQKAVFQHWIKHEKRGISKRAQDSSK